MALPVEAPTRVLAADVALIAALVWEWRSAPATPKR